MAYDPFISANPIATALNQKRGREEQTRENSSRLATCFTTWTTTGSGSKIIEDVFEFDCTFVEQPGFSAGFALDTDVGGELVITSVPTVTTGVYRWEQDIRGFYTGAYVFFKVTSTTSYVMNHYLTFTGTAIKDLPTYALED